MSKRRRGRKRAPPQKKMQGPRIERRKRGGEKGRGGRQKGGRETPSPTKEEEEEKGYRGPGVLAMGPVGRVERGQRRRGLGRPKRKFELLTNLNHLLLSLSYSSPTVP